MEDKNPAAEIFDKHARHYQDRFMDVSLYADSFDLFCNCLNTNAAVLELACGPGNITRYLLNKRPDLKILGTDLAPSMVELAQINNLTAEFALMDVKNVTEVKQKYDGLMCGFCLPYLSKLEAIQLIKDAVVVLNPRGILYISTMEENEYHQSGLKTNSFGEQLYMHYHTSAYLTQALDENGFEIVELSRKDTVAGDGSITVDLLIIARKIE